MTYYAIHAYTNIHDALAALAGKRKSELWTLVNDDNGFFRVVKAKQQNKKS